jgi:hypothetical protein
LSASQSPDSPPPFAIEVEVGRIAILAKTNREQSLIVHALFGKQNLEHFVKPARNRRRAPHALARALAKDERRHWL